MTNPSPELSPQAGAHAGQAQISVTLRYFAAATEAAGRPEERLDLPAGTTLAALRERMEAGEETPEKGEAGEKPRGTK